MPILPEYRLGSVDREDVSAPLTINILVYWGHWDKTALKSRFIH